MQQGSVTLPSMPVVFVMGQWALPQCHTNGYDAFGGQGCDSSISRRARQPDKCGRKQHNVNGKPSQTFSEATTICFQNIPNSYDRNMIFELLDTNGFKGMYDFMYVPYDFKRLPALANLGYFFVNFTSHECTLRAWSKFVGFREWSTESDKIMAATWASTTQGKTACIEHFRNSPMMHENVPLECKPVLIENGTVVHLTPTKKITKQPRFKNGYGTKLAENLSGDVRESSQDSGDQVRSDSSENGDIGSISTMAPSTTADTDSDDSSLGSDPVTSARDIGWMPDEASEICLGCDKAFTMLRRRHHCRACGCLYCAECAPRTGHNRICRGCVEGMSLASSSVPTELVTQPSGKTKVRLQTLLQTFALRRTGQLFEVKNTFIDLKLPPSECQERSESLPL